MIRNKKEYREYLNEDSRNYQMVSGRQGFFSWLKVRLGCSPISDQSKIWAYIKTLRKCELYLSKGENNPLAIYYLHKLRNLSRITGYQIPPNTVNKGLTIWHWGPIVINAYVKLGEYCVLEPGITIGHKDEGAGAPIIGNYVTICSGARIIGNITIGDDVFIAPNCVVTKSIPSHCVVVGIPARIIKTRIDIHSKWKRINQ